MLPATPTLALALAEEGTAVRCRFEGLYTEVDATLCWGVDWASDAQCGDARFCRSELAVDDTWVVAATPAPAPAPAPAPPPAPPLMCLCAPCDRGVCDGAGAGLGVALEWALAPTPPPPPRAVCAEAALDLAFEAAVK